MQSTGRYTSKLAHDNVHAKWREDAALRHLPTLMGSKIAKKTNSFTEVKYGVVDRCSWTLLMGTSFGRLIQGVRFN